MSCLCLSCWAEAPIKIARMTLTIKLDRNWSSFQLANSAPPLSVTDSAIAPSARMSARVRADGRHQRLQKAAVRQVEAARGSVARHAPENLARNALLDAQGLQHKIAAINGKVSSKEHILLGPKGPAKIA